MTTNSVEESNAEMPFSLGPSMMSMNPPKEDILRARDSTEFDPVKTVKRSPKSDSKTRANSYDQVIACSSCLKVSACLIDRLCNRCHKGLQKACDFARSFNGSAVVHASKCRSVVYTC